MAAFTWFACPATSSYSTTCSHTACSSPTTCSAAANQNYIGHTAHQVHPQFPDKLWSTKGRHWVVLAVFGALQTCNTCQANDCAHAAQLHEQRQVQEAQIAA